MTESLDKTILQIKEPVVCGITSLGMDHMETLGASLSSIVVFVTF